MENKDIIINTIDEVFDVVLISEEDTKIVKDFIVFLDAVNINTFFTDESIKNIMAHVVETVEKQDSILDFINNLQVRLVLNGLDIVNTITQIKERYLAFSKSKDLPVSLHEHIKPVEGIEDNLIINISYLVKLYGVSLIKKLD